MVSTFVSYSCASILPNVSFNEERDVEMVRDSIQKKNGRSISDIVLWTGRNTTSQRCILLQKYNQKYNVDLVEEIKKALKGGALGGGDKDCAEMIALCLMPSYDLDVNTLITAAQEGSGAEVGLFFCDVILSKTNREIEILAENFTRIKQKQLIEFTRETFKNDGMLREVLIARMSKARDEPDPRMLLYNARKGLIDEDLVKSDVLLFGEQILKDISKNAAVFISLVTTRTSVHLNSVIRHFQKQYKISLYEAIDKAINSNDTKNFGKYLAKEMHTIIRCLGERPAYFAKRIYKSLDGLGTKDNQLRRLIVSRVEIDLEDIKREYMINYRKSLRQDVYDDTSGDYRRLLMYLIGG